MPEQDGAWRVTPKPEQTEHIAAKATSEHILQFFEWGHLPMDLQEVSKPFGMLAQEIVATLPRNPERIVALRKLLEAKDAAVRAMIADPYLPS